ncbi:hypothetical protein [Rubrolithibacter danxiaensis]|uniref:hypothetical protein n=1 Tax=Rubrolithibacter danxiaensis TaxID=3390805 RepID=UPI003BF88159
MAYLRSVDMPFLLSILLSVNTIFWILACLAFGAGFAWLLYPGQKKKRLLLFILRTLLVASVAFLLVGPLFRITSRNLEKPLIILAQDNSSSIGTSKSSNFNNQRYEREFRALEQELLNKYEVKSYSFSTNVKTGLNFNYSGKATNISEFLKHVYDQYSGRNIGAVILASDGIYNKGGNPEAEAAKIKSPIFTIALGDTVPKKDVFISNVNYNNIVYQGNQFQIEVNAEAYQCKGLSSTLTVSEEGKTVSSKQVEITSNDFQVRVPVVLAAGKKGIRKYTVRLSPVSNELSKLNNEQHFFIEVIDGKLKVLIAAASPNPDITAIKQAIENNKNYEVRTVLQQEIKPADIAAAEILILHQVPSVFSSSSLVTQSIAAKPVFFILGTQSDLAAFSSAQNVLKVNPTGAFTEVLPAIKTGFNAFTLSAKAENVIHGFPPLLSPVANYQLTAPAQVLLTQRAGKSSSEKPLLLLSEDVKKRIAVLAGEGFWRWRLDEFEKNQNHEVTDEILSKILQYLGSKNNKQKFRVYPAKTTFDENESVFFNAELYNDAFELINSPDVSLNIKSEKNKNYTFLFSKTDKSYELDAGFLPAGEYTYTGNTALGSKKYTATGKFIVMQQTSELQQTTANHQLLYSLAHATNGKMIYPEDLSKLPELIKENELIKTISVEEKTYKELIELKFLFFILIALLSLEWFSRKRNGEI